MSVVLSIEQIQRSLFSALLSEGVSQGLMVDRTSVAPNDKAAYQAAQNVIKSTLGFVVELFGFSPNEEKGITTSPRITLKHTRLVPGEIGFPQVYTSVEVSPGVFKTYFLDLHSYEYHFDVNLIYQSVIEERAVYQILINTLGLKGSSIPVYDDPDSFLNYEWVSNRMDDYLDQGVWERAVAFKVVDLYLGHCKELSSSVAITQINSNIYSSSHPQSAQGLLVDDLILQNS